MSILMPSRRTPTVSGDTSSNTAVTRSGSVGAGCFGSISRRNLPPPGNAAVQASSATLMQVHLINELEGEEKARDFLIEHLSQRPSVRGLEGLIELQLDTATGKAREHLSILRDLMRELLQEQPKYRCEHCGFAGKTLHWQCPSCKHWSTIKPVQGVAAE